EAALALWAAWCAIAVVRVVRAAFALRRARTACLELPEQRRSSLAAWSRNAARGRRARLVVSADVQSAAVLGCVRPVIAIAPVLVDRLEDDELDRVVIHEWAHVQRRDDLANLVQLGVWAIAGWHPAVWWLDRQLRLEREVACDDMVVALTGSAKAYAS